MQKKLHIIPKWVNKNGEEYSVWNLGLDVPDSFRRKLCGENKSMLWKVEADIYTHLKNWDYIDELISWASSEKKWYKIDYAEIKKRFNKIAHKERRIDNYDSTLTGLIKMNNEYSYQRNKIKNIKEKYLKNVLIKKVKRNCFV